MLKICFVSEKQVLSKCIAAAKTLNIYDSNKAVPLKRNNYKGRHLCILGGSMQEFEQWWTVKDTNYWPHPRTQWTTQSAIEQFILNRFSTFKVSYQKSINSRVS